MYYHHHQISLLTIGCHAQLNYKDVHMIKNTGRG